VQRPGPRDLIITLPGVLGFYTAAEFATHVRRHVFRTAVGRGRCDGPYRQPDPFSILPQGLFRSFCTPPSASLTAPNQCRPLSLVCTACTQCRVFHSRRFPIQIYRSLHIIQKHPVPFRSTHYIQIIYVFSKKYSKSALHYRRWIEGCGNRPAYPLVPALILVVGMPRLCGN
jgi:hypothetical protein